MSCRNRCGVLSDAQLGNQAGNATPEPNPPPQSHRPFHLTVERNPSRPEAMGGFADYAGYGNIRIPPAARASTPGPCGYPSQFDTFGSQIENNMGWMPRDVNLAELLEQTAGQMPPRCRRDDQAPPMAPEEEEPVDPNASPQLTDELLNDELFDSKNEKDRQESLMEWFDRSVEKELKKHKGSTVGAGIESPIPDLDPDALPDLNLSRGTLERISGATASQLEMCLDLRKEPDTALTDAVSKFAKAQAMCEFAGAVRAAEAAAEAVPPELAEEAALASARGFQTDVRTTGLQGELEGAKPIEIVGYVGVTKPKYPMKRQ